MIDRGLRKLAGYLKPILIPLRRAIINNDDFTIISNNCWGGVVYEYYGLPKMSPTVGSWFFAADYLKFVGNLKYYLSLDIQVCPSVESRYYSKLLEMGSADCVIGKLEDIEVIMLHYHDPKEAKEKWERRKKRVNYDNLIVKFSYMNECTLSDLSQFDQMDLSHISPNCKKIMFVPKPMEGMESAVYYKGFESDPQITNDTYFFNRYFNLPAFINGGGIIPRH